MVHFCWGALFYIKVLFYLHLWALSYCTLFFSSVLVFSTLFWCVLVPVTFVLSFPLGDFILLSCNCGVTSYSPSSLSIVSLMSFSPSFSLPFYLLFLWSVFFSFFFSFEGGTVREEAETSGRELPFGGF